MGPESPRLSSGDAWPFRRASRVEEWHTSTMDDAPDGHTVHRVVSHLIWCPTRRRTGLIGPIRNRLEQIVGEVAAENEWTVIELALQPDPVHRFIRADPNPVPSDRPRRIAGRSSPHVRREFSPLRKLPSMWT